MTEQEKPLHSFRRPDGELVEFFKVTESNLETALAIGYAGFPGEEGEVALSLMSSLKPKAEWAFSGHDSVQEIEYHLMVATGADGQKRPVGLSGLYTQAETSGLTGSWLGLTAIAPSEQGKDYGSALVEYERDEAIRRGLPVLSAWSLKTPEGRFGRMHRILGRIFGEGILNQALSGAVGDFLVFRKSLPAGLEKGLPENPPYQDWGNMAGGTVGEKKRAEPFMPLVRATEKAAGARREARATRDGFEPVIMDITPLFISTGKTAPISYLRDEYMEHFPRSEDAKVLARWTEKTRRDFMRINDECFPLEDERETFEGFQQARMDDRTGRFGKNGRFILGAFSPEGELIGFTYGHAQTLSEEARKRDGAGASLGIVYMAVDPAYRERGVARKLETAAIERTRQFYLDDKEAPVLVFTEQNSANDLDVGQSVRDYKSTGLSPETRRGWWKQGMLIFNYIQACLRPELEGYPEGYPLELCMKRVDKDGKTEDLQRLGSKTLWEIVESYATLALMKQDPRRQSMEDDPSLVAMKAQCDAVESFGFVPQKSAWDTVTDAAKHYAVMLWAHTQPGFDMDQTMKDAGALFDAHIGRIVQAAWPSANRPAPRSTPAAPTPEGPGSKNL